MRLIKLSGCVFGGNVILMTCNDNPVEFFFVSVVPVIRAFPKTEIYFDKLLLMV